ncbi:hypothetical protein [Faecalibacter rhinopitheci]|uniref:Phosphoribosylpyrophosphate synthetase n=1 Tax=Faecalibacter rhinopitheci TaxID=2779678 RepID=A0A8J7KAV8_9FLAO|nr:hypothetical protein [Faecalibacter rhinopitheci]MBF0597955.1 hypothetical protein [Faecalibacter rhinopitheci]MBQ0147954.1 hypothetical protein [Candidatus Onthonaster equi]
MFEHKQFLYASSSEALIKLKNKGYEMDFNLNQDRILEHPTDFKIIYIFRYEGESSPEDSSTVYGIECLSSGEKGVFVMGNPAHDNSNGSVILNLLEIEGRYS